MKNYLTLLFSLHISLAQTLVTVAGGGPSTGSPALSSSLTLTQAVTLDAAGRLYFSSQSRVFRLEANGTLTRIAGESTSGFSGDGGPAIDAQLRTPYGLAVDAAGNVYISDYGNHRIRKVDTAGIITTVAGNGDVGFSGDENAAINARLWHPCGINFDKAGNLYIADSGNHRIRKVTPEGVITTVVGYVAGGFSGDEDSALAAQVLYPTDVVFDSKGSMYIADSGNNRIRRVTPEGIMKTFAGTGSYTFGGDGGAATSAQFRTPIGIAVDASDNVYVSDYTNHRIRRIASGGTITTIAGSAEAGFSGDNGQGTSAKLYFPRGIAVDASGNITFADLYNQRIRRITSAGNISTIAGNGLFGFGGDGGSAFSAQLNQPSAAVKDASGNLWIADTGNHRLRKISPDGVVSTALGDGNANASGLSFPAALAIDPTGNLFIADTGNNRIRQVAPDGGVTNLSITPALRNPAGLATDAQGNLYIADTGNHVVLKRTPSGDVTTLIPYEAGLNSPYGLAVDTLGNLYVADLYNQRVVRRSAGGELSVVMEPRQNGFPVGVAVDGTGILYVTYYGQHELYSKAPGAVPQRLLGKDSLYFPQGLALTTSGELLISDTGNNRVVKITLADTQRTVEP